MFKLRKGPCALEESVWKQDAFLFQCSSPGRVYHCISDEKNRLGEICVQPVWVNPSKYRKHSVCTISIVAMFDILPIASQI